MDAKEFVRIFNSRQSKYRVEDTVGWPRFPSAVDRRMAAARDVIGELSDREVLQLLAELATDRQISTNRTFMRHCRTVLLWWIDRRGHMPQELISELLGEDDG